MGLVQGAFEIGWDLQRAIDVMTFVVKGQGLAVDVEFLVNPVAHGVRPELVGPVYKEFHVGLILKLFAAVVHLVGGDLGFVGELLLGL